MNLARIMAERGLNQVELSKRSGVSQQLISSYLREGKTAKGPNLRNLLALGRALNCSLEELTGQPAWGEIEKKAEEMSETPDRYKRIIDALLAMPETDPRRIAIEEMMLTFAKLLDKPGEKAG